MRGAVSIKDAVFESAGDILIRPHAAAGIPGKGPHVNRLGDVVMVPAPTGYVREAGKRFFSLFLAAVMMVSLLAVNAHAANTNKITDYGDAGTSRR